MVLVHSGGEAPKTNKRGGLCPVTTQGTKANDATELPVRVYDDRGDSFFRGKGSMIAPQYWT